MEIQLTEKKERKINTENRMVTINKRETSFEGLVSNVIVTTLNAITNINGNQAIFDNHNNFYLLLQIDQYKD